MSATNLNQEQEKITFQLLKKKHDEGFARFKQVQKRHLIRKEIGKLLKIYQNPDIIPKIGEFLVVSKNSDFNPQKVIGANVMGLLDVRILYRKFIRAPKHFPPKCNKSPLKALECALTLR
jgi:hypothetical protein